MSGNSVSDLAARCIRCGFCLESCPTYLETGEETESPRGRIYLMKSADRGELPWEALRDPVDHCLGCRACETACPSGVEYSHLLELGREKLGPSQGQRLAVSLGTNVPLLRLSLALSSLFGLRHMPGWLSRRLSGESVQIPVPTAQPKAKSTKVLPTSEGREVVFLQGCAMRVIFPQVHAASRALLARRGYRVTPIELGCCGALHAHGGQLEEGVGRVERLRALAGGRPVVTDSAGCGAWLKEQGVSTLDLSEAIADIDLKQAQWTGRVTYHDACHLAHGQGIRSGPRDLIRRIPGVEFVELPESDMCCGSAGTYNLTQPEMAKRLLERKWANIRETGAQTVVLANPGCHAWIGRGAVEGVRVMHLAELLAEALRI